MINFKPTRLLKEEKKGILNRLHKDNKGFTLVELLIVIFIIDVLAAIIVPNVTGLIW